ncbi:unnamed protein product [Diatraea saccharalis]|uniref:Uncharacterized protein n=1 Tax=Diatraea saccharalis TaxID=40085 RepID=A0A9N9R779_9NEOP|nr:unnamed protein product [Diatraea saccharalis]
MSIRKLYITWCMSSCSWLLAVCCHSWCERANAAASPRSSANSPCSAPTLHTRPPLHIRPARPAARPLYTHVHHYIYGQLALQRAHSTHTSTITYTASSPCSAPTLHTRPPLHIRPARPAARPLYTHVHHYIYGQLALQRAHSTHTSTITYTASSPCSAPTLHTRPPLHIRPARPAARPLYTHVHHYIYGQLALQRAHSTHTSTITYTASSPCSAPTLHTRPPLHIRPARPAARPLYTHVHHYIYGQLALQRAHSTHTSTITYTASSPCSAPTLHTRPPLHIRPARPAARPLYTHVHHYIYGQFALQRAHSTHTSTITYTASSPCSAPTLHTRPPLHIRPARPAARPLYTHVHHYIYGQLALQRAHSTHTSTITYTASSPCSAPTLHTRPPLHIRPARPAARPLYTHVHHYIYGQLALQRAHSTHTSTITYTANSPCSAPTLHTRPPLHIRPVRPAARPLYTHVHHYIYGQLALQRAHSTHTSTITYTASSPCSAPTLHTRPPLHIRPVRPAARPLYTHVHTQHTCTL